MAATLIAIVNLLICGWRMKASFSSGRLVSMAWALITYHSVFLVQLAIGGGFSKYRGFTNDYITVDEVTIWHLTAFALMFNLIFAAVEGGIGRFLHLGKQGRGIWTIPVERQWLRNAQWMYAIFLVIGGLWYWLTIRGGGYRDYVEFTRSNWPLVFLWASAPLITILAMRKKIAIALIACLPFLFFAVYLKVRSFALLSVVPVFVVLYFQGTDIAVGKRRRFFRPLLAGGMIFVVFVAVSVLVTYKKAADIAGLENAPGEVTGLPDAGMVYGSAIVFRHVDATGEVLGASGLWKYLWNLVSPFMRMFGKAPPEGMDPAVYMASIVDGVPLNSGIMFHYPTLWYSDAYLTFGVPGLLLAVLWGAIFSLAEWVMLRNQIVLAIFLPFFTWHIYMIIRGTPAIASVPFSYAAYMSVLVMLVFSQMRFWKRRRSSGRQAV